MSDSVTSETHFTHLFIFCREGLVTSSYWPAQVVILNLTDFLFQR